MGKTLAVIQTRMTSTRLPGKVLMDIEGKPMLQRVVERVTACSEIDGVVVATTTNLEDDPVVELCKKLGYSFYRGNEADVLGRHIEAAEEFEGDLIVRICSDSPLIDPKLSAEMIAQYKKRRDRYAMGIINATSSYPFGCNTQVFSLETLKRIDPLATKDYERSHVTIYMEERPEEYPIFELKHPTENHSDIRVTVDTPEDMEFARQLYRRFNRLSRDFTWRDIVEVVKKEPHLRKINQNVKQKEKHLG